MTDHMLSRRAAGYALAAWTLGAASAAAASSGRRQDRTVTAQNGAASMSVRVEGSGPAVLMLPSLGRGAEDFDALAARLIGSGFTVIRPQPRGVADSWGPMAALSLDDLAGDAAASMHAAGATSAVVVGHAFGNRVARRLATVRPELVRAVILLAAGGKVRMAPDIEVALGKCFDLTLPEPERLAAVSKAFFAPGNDPIAWRGGWWPKVAEAQLGATERTPVDLWWSAGGKPILVLQGMDDALAPPANATQLKVDLGAQVTLISLPRAGHAMLPEQPALIARNVIRFARRYS